MDVGQTLTLSLEKKHGDLCAEGSPHLGHVSLRSSFVGNEHKAIVHAQSLYIVCLGEALDLGP